MQGRARRESGGEEFALRMICKRDRDFSQWRDECLQIAAFNLFEKLLAVSAIDGMTSQKICENIGVNEHLSRNLHVLLLDLPSISQSQRSCW